MQSEECSDLVFKLLNKKEIVILEEICELPSQLKKRTIFKMSFPLVFKHNVSQIINILITRLKYESGLKGSGFSRVLFCFYF